MKPKNYKMTETAYESNAKHRRSRFSRIRRVAASLVLTLTALSAAQAETASIDVLVVYTAAVKADQDNHDGVEATARVMIAKGNFGFQNSLIDAEFNLVHVEEIEYTESASFNTDLDTLTNDEDVLTLREDWGADIVCLLRSGSIGGTAGLGWVLKDETGRDTTGFSVASVQSSVSANTFTHEVGHNLGAAHDADNSAVDDGLYLYSHGQHFDGGTPDSHRTIMAYQKNFNTQVNFFSNPNVSHLGSPTGNAEGTANPADNAKTLNVTTSVVAAYRVNQTPIPSFPTPFPNLAFVEGQSKTILAQAVGTPDLSYQWYEGVSGETSNPVDGATESSFTTPILNDTTVYWVRATNPNGSSDSLSIILTTTSIPIEDNVLDQNHDPANDPFLQFSVANGVVWQEFVPSASYLHQIEVRIWKDGTPGRMSLNFTDENGVVLFSKIYEEGDITSTFQWFTIPLQMYVDTGKAYRISMQRLDEGSGFYAWQQSTNDTYLAGSSSRDDGDDLYDYYFRTTGSSATPPTADINPNQKTIAGGAGNYDITVTSTGDWNAAEALDWLSLDPTSGNGNGTVTVTVTANNTGSDRLGSILVGGNNHSITQSPSAFEGSLTPLEASFAAAGANASLALTTEHPWSATSDSWITITSPTSGTGDATVDYTFSENTAPTPRTGTITIESLTHTVQQFGTVLTFNEWLLAYYTSEEIAAQTPSAGKADPDGDGLNNNGEFLLLLDPSSRHSGPQIVATKISNGIVLTISPRVDGVVYRLNSSTNMITWTPEPSLTPTVVGDTVTFTIPAGSEKFFQLEIQAAAP
ncbi:MAG: hypothetical protein HOI15_15885 [Opitutales bacterium]|nr:hypothetical protein [Opitutales bacterium]